VAEFERCRSPHVTSRLISPRWILKSIAADKTDDDKAADGISSKDKSAEKSSDTNHHHDSAQEERNNNNEPSKFNTVPKRTYLDIRMEQNTIFAIDQCLRCQKKLAALSSTSPKSVEAINVNRTQIKKVIDSIRNHLKEGLSACPNHEGLVQVESEVQVWLDRLNGVAAVDRVLDTAAATMAGAKERRGNSNNETIIDLTEPDTQQQIVMKRKGGDGRAQAAIDDALVEKMFLQGDKRNGGDPNNHDDAVDTNRGNLKWVPPASRVDESADQHMRREECPSDSDSHYDRKRSRHHGRRRRSRYQSKSRSRSRSVERIEERRIGERRRHRHERSSDDSRKRKRKKRRHRSRSRSMSRGSLSPTASLPSHSTSRDRSRRRHRGDRHKHKRRHKSKSHRKESRKESRKSSKRHRSRRDHSPSVSPSSRPSVSGYDDDMNGRFVPPRLSQSEQHERGGERPVQREGIESCSVPQLNENKTSLEITDRSAIEQMEIEASHAYS